MHFNLRYFWPGLVILIGAACQPSRTVPTPAAVTPSPKMTVVSQREYHVRQQLTLVNEGPGQPEKQNLWVALIHDLLPYQQVQSMEVVPEDYQPVTDEYGNQYAEFDFSEHPAGATITVRIDYRVVVN